MRCHENSSPAILGRTLTSQSVDLSVVVNLVVLEHGQLNLPVLVLDLFWGGVILLLTLLAATPPAENEMESGLLLNVVVGQRASVLQLLSSKD